VPVSEERWLSPEPEEPSLPAACEPVAGALAGSRPPPSPESADPRSGSGPDGVLPPAAPDEVPPALPLLGVAVPPSPVTVAPPPSSPGSGPIEVGDESPSPVPSLPELPVPPSFPDVVDGDPDGFPPSEAVLAVWAAPSPAAAVLV